MKQPPFDKGIGRSFVVNEHQFGVFVSINPKNTTKMLPTGQGIKQTIVICNNVS